MANDNNKINELASYSDDDPTLELEIPVLYADPSQFADDDTEYQAQDDQPTIAVLRSNLISSGEHIEQLQFEIEEVRAHSKQLELEVESIGKVAPGVDPEMDALRSRLRATENDLAERDQQNTDMACELHQTALAAIRLGDETDQFRRVAKSDRSRIRRLENQLKSRDKKLSATTKRLKKSLSDRHLKPAGDTPDPRIAELESQLSRSQGEIEKFTRQLTARIDECDRLRVDNREIRMALHNGSDSEMEQNQVLIAKQSGLISGYSQEIRALLTRIGSTEEYANDLRRKLQQQSDTADRAVNAQHGLQAALDSARDNSRNLTNTLEESQQLASDLSDSVQKHQLDYAAETQRLQVELDSAQEIVDGQATINERLQSELYDNKGFRQALELQLDETVDKSDQLVRQLEQKLQQLENRADDDERKMKNKDEAITALMTELANRSSKVETISEIENVIQEIDYRETTRSGDQILSERERVTRLLVGSNEGQELRFPLFKNRLTIGRTPHNDIQLNAQFISRRHAVIVTESGGTRIVDWGSKNGIFVNDKRVAEHILKNGDIVTIGTTEFRYEERPKR